jgi:hypothetical protein
MLTITYLHNGGRRAMAIVTFFVLGDGTVGVAIEPIEPISSVSGRAERLARFGWAVEYQP